MQNERTPTIEEVTQIFYLVHNVWFKKYKHAKSDQEFQDLLKDAKLLIEKHPCNLTYIMVKEISEIIHLNAKEGNNDAGI